MQDVVCEKIREPPFPGFFFFFLAQTSAFSLQGSNEGGLNWQELDK